MEWITRCDEPARLRQGMENAKARDRMDIYWQAFRRLCEIEGLKYEDPVERGFYSALAAHEFLLSEKKGRATKATRTRLKLKTKSVVECLEEWAVAADPSEGFEMLAETGQLELTGEYLVVKFAEHFSADAQIQARDRLDAAGWQPPEAALPAA